MNKSEAETILNYFMNLGARVGSDDLKWLMDGGYSVVCAHLWINYHDFNGAICAKCYLKYKDK